MEVKYITFKIIQCLPLKNLNFNTLAKIARNQIEDKMLLRCKKAFKFYSQIVTFGQKYTLTF